MGKTTISVDDEVADRLYARKSRGESYNGVILKLLDTVEEDERSPDDVASSDSTDSLQKPENESNHSLDHSLSESLKESINAVADDVLPGSGKKHIERKEALHAVVEYLRQHGEATPSTFKNNVYPEHPAQFNTPQSWWKNAMYKGLAELAQRTDFIKRADNSGKWTFNNTEESD